MQIPNFPNEVYLLNAQPGPSGGGIKVRVTRIPAKYNAASVSTINNRRLKMDKFGKIEVYAEGPAVLIVTTWAKSEHEIEALVDKMHQKIQNNLQYRLEKIQSQLLGTVSKPTILVKDYAD